MIKRALLAAGSLLAAAGAAGSQDEAAGVGAFDFLVGAHECDGLFITPDGERIEYQAVWSGGRILDDRVIADEFRIDGPDGEPFQLGSNFRVHIAETDQWSLRWLDALTGEWVELADEAFGGVTVTPASVSFVNRRADGVLVRVRFTDISESGFSWYADRSSDEGAIWAENFQEITCRRTAEL